MHYPAPDGLVAASTNTEGLPSWDLTDLYSAPGSPALEADLSRAAADAQAFQAQYAGTLSSRSGAELAAALAAYERIEEVLGRLVSYAQLLFSGDSTDPAIGSTLNAMGRTYFAGVGKSTEEPSCTSDVACS